jgi:hypothetical protein
VLFLLGIYHNCSWPNNILLARNIGSYVIISHLWALDLHLLIFLTYGQHQRVISFLFVYYSSLCFPRLSFFQENSKPSTTIVRLHVVVVIISSFFLSLFQYFFIFFVSFICRVSQFLALVLDIAHMTKLR